MATGGLIALQDEFGRYGYRFQDGQVIDHENREIVPEKKIMKGEMDLLW